MGFFPLFFWKLCLHSKVSLTLLWCKYNLFWGLVKSSFRWNQKKRTTKTQRIMETFGKKCIIGLTSAGEISVPEDWSPLLLAALGWFSVSWDWMQVLATCRFHAGTRQANCAAWSALEVGNLGRPLARSVGAQPIRTGGRSGQGSPLAAAACPVSQGRGLGGGRAQRVVLGAESVPASLRGLGTRLSRLRVQPGSPD